MELETNPLIIGSTTPLETILENILEELSTAYFYAFQSEITNDPALDAGDTVRLQGGVINGTNKNNDLIGFITHSTWVYRKRQTITNASSVPIVYEDAASGIALMSDDDVSPLADSEPLNFLPPRSQSDKAQLGLGGDMTELVYALQGFKWKLKLNANALELFDPGGGLLGRLMMFPNSFTFTPGQSSGVTEKVSLQLTARGFQVNIGSKIFDVNVESDTIAYIGKAGTCSLNAANRTIGFGDQMLKFDPENQTLLFNGKRVLTE